MTNDETMELNKRDASQNAEDEELATIAAAAFYIIKNNRARQPRPLTPLGSRAFSPWRNAGILEAMEQLPPIILDTDERGR